MAKLDTDEALIQAALAAVRPFVRRLLQKGVSFGRLEKRLREVFVDVAEHEVTSSDGRQTDSRISALTGLNRKGVRRIRREEEGRPAPKSFSRNLAASLISRWMNDPQATRSTGRPVAIPYDASQGPSFVKLADADVVVPTGGTLRLIEVVLARESGTVEFSLQGVEFYGFVEALRCEEELILVTPANGSMNLVEIETRRATIERNDSEIDCDDLIVGERVEVEAEAEDGMTLFDIRIEVEDDDGEGDDWEMPCRTVRPCQVLHTVGRDLLEVPGAALHPEPC